MSFAKADMFGAKTTTKVLEWLVGITYSRYQISKPQPDQDGCGVWDVGLRRERSAERCGECKCKPLEAKDAANINT